MFLPLVLGNNYIFNHFYLQLIYSLVFFIAFTISFNYHYYYLIHLPQLQYEYFLFVTNYLEVHDGLLENLEFAKNYFYITLKPLFYYHLFHYSLQINQYFNLILNFYIDFHYYYHLLKSYYYL